MTATARPAHDCDITRRGFDVPCIKCGAGGAVTVALSEVTSTPEMHVFTCRQCGETFSRDDVVALLACWAPCLAWLNTAPVYLPLNAK